MRAVSETLVLQVISPEELEAVAKLARIDTSEDVTRIHSDVHELLNFGRYRMWTRVLYLMHASQADSPVCPTSENYPRRGRFRNRTFTFSS